MAWNFMLDFFLWRIFLAEFCADEFLMHDQISCNDKNLRYHSCFIECAYINEYIFAEKSISKSMEFMPRYTNFSPSYFTVLNS